MFRFCFCLHDTVSGFLYRSTAIDRLWDLSLLASGKERSITLLHHLNLPLSSFIQQRFAGCNHKIGFLQMDSSHLPLTVFEFLCCYSPNSQSAEQQLLSLACDFRLSVACEGGFRPTPNDEPSWEEVRLNCLPVSLFEDLWTKSFLTRLLEISSRSQSLEKTKDGFHPKGGVRCCLCCRWSPPLGLLVWALHQSCGARRHGSRLDHKFDTMNQFWEPAMAMWLVSLQLNLISKESKETSKFAKSLDMAVHFKVNGQLSSRWCGRPAKPQPPPVARQISKLDSLGFKRQHLDPTADFSVSAVAGMVSISENKVKLLTNFHQTQINIHHSTW